jgi:N-acetylneuraminic acid mutarotase
MDNTAAELDGFIYSVGGLDGFNTLNTGYRYDPGSDSWSAIADMADVRQKPAAAFINDKLYVVGGWGVFGDTLTSLEIYDPATNSWSTGSPVPVGYAAATAVALNGQMYVIGGCSSSCGFTDVYRYDPDRQLGDSGPIPCTSLMERVRRNKESDLLRRRHNRQRRNSFHLRLQPGLQ